MPKDVATTARSSPYEKGRPGERDRRSGPGPGRAAHESDGTHDRYDRRDHGDHGEYGDRRREAAPRRHEASRSEEAGQQREATGDAATSTTTAARVSSNGNLGEHGAASADAIARVRQEESGNRMNAARRAGRKAMG